MRLYNMSIGAFPEVRCFVPLVPRSASSYEDQTIPRICLAPSPALCAQAIFLTGEDPIVTLYSADFDISDKDLISPYAVQRYVPDAIADSEFWYMREVDMHGKQYYVRDINVVFDINWYIVPKRLLADVCSSVLFDDGLFQYVPAVLDIIWGAESTHVAFNAVLDMLKNNNQIDVTYDLFDEVDDAIVDVPEYRLRVVDKLYLEEVNGTERIRFEQGEYIRE